MKDRILVVDDERSIRFALTHYFTNHGFTVDSATNYDEARSLVEGHEYTLAIVDIHLSGRSEAAEGLDLAAYIRVAAPPTAVVILTGLETPESLQRATEVGVRSFFRKPAPLAEVADVAFAVVRERGDVLARR